LDRFFSLLRLSDDPQLKYMKHLIECGNGRVVAGDSRRRRKVPFWDWIKFEAKRSKRSVRTVSRAFYKGRLVVDSTTGGHWRKQVSVPMSSAEYFDFLTFRLMNRFARHRCECGALGVLKNSANAWVCVQCYWAEDIQSLRSRPEPGMGTYKIHCEI
jgi:hypothetical protein